MNAFDHILSIAAELNLTDSQMIEELSRSLYYLLLETDEELFYSFKNWQNNAGLANTGKKRTLH